MREISLSSLQFLLNDDPPALLIDSRGTEYWLWESIQGSSNIRWKEIPQRAPRALPDKSTPIVLFCQNPDSNSSRKSYVLLNEMGYKNLWHYPGGLDEWKSNNLPTQSSSFKVSDRSLRLPHQRFYGEEIGCYVINSEDALLIVDGPHFLSDSNEDFLLSFDKPIKILLTHGATAGIASLLHQNFNAQIFLHEKDRENEWLTCTPTDLFTAGFEISPGFQVLHTPGPTPGSCSLYDEKEGLLYSGALLQGASSSEILKPTIENISTTDTRIHLSSLASLLPLNIRAVYPFQNAPLTQDPVTTLAHFLKRSGYDPE